MVMSDVTVMTSSEEVNAASYKNVYQKLLKKDKYHNGTVEYRYSYMKLQKEKTPILAVFSNWSYNIDVVFYECKNGKAKVIGSYYNLSFKDCTFDDIKIGRKGNKYVFSIYKNDNFLIKKSGSKVKLIGYGKEISDRVICTRTDIEKNGKCTNYKIISSKEYNKKVKTNEIVKLIKTRDI